MRVVLLSDIENIGKQFEIKEVADGYARNFLIPQGLVRPATKQTLQWLSMQKEIAEKKAEDALKQTQELASKLDDLEVSIPMKVGEEGQLFEAITAAKIADRLKEMGYDVKKNQVKIENPIKELGEFPVKIAFDHNLEAEISVIVTEEESNG
ncbi:MAG: 50S ribosomal protein L9 [Candidatus Wildermuthbacteria bacterium]|nr:50S ribosomal protein L9 [Candidatus Wildermuthbacteria bacterium]